MKRFYLVSSNRCYRRALDTEKIINYLRLNNYLIVKDISQADFIYIITCAGIKKLEDSSIDLIKKVLKAKNKNSEIIIGGCLPEINRRRLSKLGKFKTLPPKSINKLDDIIHPKIKFKSIKDPNTLKPEEYMHSETISLFKKNFKFEFSPLFLIEKIDDILSLLMAISRHKRGKLTFHKTYLIRISSGCSGKCSYCGIKFALGKLKSKPINMIIDEFERGLEQGYKIFILSSEDSGSYGSDINTNIVELLKEIFKHRGDYSVTIHAFNPTFLVKYYDELLPLIKENSEKIDHICIPIQSGSDRILKRMKRSYKIKQVERCLSELKESVKDIEISTSIIVGFPSETKEDFKKSMELIKKMGFDAVLFNRYSDRPRTEANKMKNKIPERIKIYRKWKLMFYYYLWRKWPQSSRIKRVA